MNFYDQISGELSCNNDLITTGYSGHGIGLNNPALEEEPFVGPIPRGFYTITGPFYSTTHGPYVFKLTPKPGTNTFGRSEFLLHGDKITQPGLKLGSEGCIVAERSARNIIGKNLATEPELTVT